MKTPLTGIVTPLITPLLDNDTLDAQGLERLVERTVAGGVQGIFVLGTTGEFASISYALQGQFVRSRVF
jgi:2-dehydro-3-deoxy-D-pentonate aldolase